MIEVDYNRKIISTEVDGVHFDSLTLSELHDKVDDFMEKYGMDAKVNLVQCHFSDSDRYLGIFKDIEETNEQMTFRIAQEESWASEGRKAALRQLEHLKKQLGIIQ